MKKALAALFTLAALGLAGTGSAQTGDTVSGVVVSANNDSVVIRMDDGAQRTFVTDFTTTMPSARLAEGNRVTVRYNALEGGRWQATAVTLAGETPSASRPSPTERRDPADPAPRTLPETASELPLAAAIGGAALVGALGLTALRRSA